jgi:hypothetical protein
MRPVAIAIVIGFTVLPAPGCRTRISQGSSRSEVLPPTEPPQDPAKSAVKLSLSKDRIDYIHARAEEPVPTPEYPARALAANAGDYSLYVTLTVNPDGSISDIHPTLGQIQMPSPYFDDFLVSAQAALIHWKVSAPRLVYWKRMPDGEMRYLRTETDSTTIDLKISFLQTTETR